MKTAGDRMMKTYRVYSLLGNGSITGEREIDAASDDEAVFAVRAMQRDLVTEIWQRDRRIARVPPYEPPQQGPILL
jgi:hypothetical protein